MRAPLETAVETLLTFRDTMRSVCPPWLQRGTAEKLLYSIAMQADAFGDALVAGVKQRFPGLYSYDSLALLGRERRIPRSRNEDDATYALRLTRFLESHKRRGGPYALLEQLYIYFAPEPFPIDLVYVAGGRHFHMDTAGGITRSPTGFTFDTHPKWARWWLIYNTDQYEPNGPSEEEIAQLRVIPRQWNAAHPNGMIIILSSTGELWNWPLGRTWNESGTWNVTDGTPPVYIDVEPV